MEYETIEKLGEGGHGEVWKVKIKGQEYALKTAVGEDVPILRQEADILKELCHPAIPTFFAYEENKQGGYLLMEWMDGEPLVSLCKEELLEPVLLNYAMQILDILKYLHTKQILYLDLKPENMLITSNGFLQLIDFSSAQHKDTQNPNLHYGTKGFAAPQQFQEGYLDERADIYAFGKVMMALALGIEHGELLDCYSVEDLAYSDAFQHLLKQCLMEAQEQRLCSVSAVQQELKHWQSHIQQEQRMPKYRWWKVTFLCTLGFLLCGCRPVIAIGW